MVKPKANNIAGLQLADILAHPSRNEILVEHSPGSVRLAPFAGKVAKMLAKKYYQRGGEVYGKKFLQEKRPFRASPMAFAIDLQ